MVQTSLPEMRNAGIAAVAPRHKREMARLGPGRWLWSHQGQDLYLHERRAYTVEARPLRLQHGVWAEPLMLLAPAAQQTAHFLCQFAHMPILVGAQQP